MGKPAQRADIVITQIRHPMYRENSADWRKWRLAYEGGRAFINAYLERYTKRESTDEFNVRKKLTYCPRFAGAAIDDVKNAIYQRMVDISRADGDKTYLDAAQGLDGGVDLDGSTMNRFIGQLVLPELLVMSKVGVYIDMPPVDGPTLADAYGKKPYLYYYCAEDIASWVGDYQNNRMEYTTLLLRDTETQVNDVITELPANTKTTWRFYKLTPEGVNVIFYDQSGTVLSSTTLLGMTRIPFVIFEIPRSLMEDIADYQIALMNLESSDIGYMMKSNFPFYVEQYDPRADMVNYGKPQNPQDGTTPATPGDGRQEVQVGASSGRRYPLQADAPSFIHPSPEPLMASMQKEQQIKNDIRKLLNLSLNNLEPTFASAESKGMDDRSLESGLSAIGLVLQHGENQISEVWAEYLKSKPTQVIYPRNYSLKSETERREEAKNDSELMVTVPSTLYRKAMAKKIAKTMVGHLVTAENMDKITAEIEKAGYISSDVDSITKDLEKGLVSNKTASEARGYAPDEVEQAKKDQAERLKLIQDAQTPPGGEPKNPGARGIGDKNPTPGNTNPDNTNRPSSGGGGASGAIGQ